MTRNRNQEATRSPSEGPPEFSRAGQFAFEPEKKGKKGNKDKKQDKKQGKKDKKGRRCDLCTPCRWGCRAGCIGSKMFCWYLFVLAVTMSIGLFTQIGQFCNLDSSEGYDIVSPADMLGAHPHWLHTERRAGVGVLTSRGCGSRPCQGGRQEGHEGRTQAVQEPVRSAATACRSGRQRLPARALLLGLLLRVAAAGCCCRLCC